MALPSPYAAQEAVKEFNADDIDMTGNEIAPPGWPYRANAPTDSVGEMSASVDAQTPIDQILK